MRKFFLGAFVGVLFTFVILFVAVGVLIKIGSSKKPTIASNSALVLNLEGDLPEVPSIDIEIPLLQTQAPPTIRDMWAAMHAAATDPRIKAIVLKPRNLSVGWGKLEELREEIAEFKQRSGKPVYAYLETPGMHEYFLASVADKIYVSPDDYLEVKGFLIEETYLKGTLDKLGIGFDVDHIGRYKDAGDIFTRSNMSSDTREVMNGVLDQVLGSFCTAVGGGRHKSPDDIRALIDQGPFLAAAAKSAGLVDELGYESQLYRDLTSRVKAAQLAKLSYKTYVRSVASSGERIALLAGEGDIIRGSLDQPLSQTDVIASDTFSKTIDQVRKDSTIKGVILRVDSPGGDAVASDEILHELQLLSAEKPVVISMSDLAASGGYFISMTGDAIVAYPDTITGSIGVLYGKPNFRGFYGKIGVTKDLLSRGKFADIDSDYTPLSDPEKQKLHEGIVSTYRSFVTKVAAARKKSYEQIDLVAQGRVWMGAQAEQNGLVDRLGGLDSAVELIRERAKLPARARVNLVAYPPRMGLLDALLNASPDTLTQDRANGELKQLFGDSLPSPALLRGGILTLMPYRISIH
ncbi:MAG: signal peptide peptidase SppA [Bryobacteraceae bacterium]